MARPPRIVMFAPAFPPFGNPEAIVNGKLALALLNAGFDVTVVSRALYRESAYSYGSEWSDPWLPLQPHTHEITYPLGNLLQRLAGTLRAGLRMRHLVDGCRWGAAAAELALELHDRQPFEMVVSRAGPESAHLAALHFHRRNDVPWVANWNDPWGPKHPRPFGRGPDARLGVAQERLMNEVAREADWHTFPCDAMRRYVCSYLRNGTLERSSVIPHVALPGSDPVALQPAARFSVLYTGNLQVHRSPQTMIEGFGIFCTSGEADDSIRLTFVGQSAHPISQLAESAGVASRVEVLPPRGYGEVGALARASAVLTLIENFSEPGIYLPAKLVDYAQTCRPILALTPAGSTVEHLVNAHRAGLAVDCDSPPAVAKALGSLHRLWRDGRLNDEWNSRGLLATFSPERVVGEYAGLALRLRSARTRRR